MVKYDVSTGTSQLKIKFNIYFTTLISTVVPCNPGDNNNITALPDLSRDW